MRKLVVSNLISVGINYEAPDRDLNALFDHLHEDNRGDDHFDRYDAELLRAADTLLLKGRAWFLGFKDYWSAVTDDPGATAIRREMSQIVKHMDKVVVPDRLTCHDLAPWDNTRILR